MAKGLKRTAVLLAIVLCLGLLPAGAYAEAAFNPAPEIAVSVAQVPLDEEPAVAVAEDTESALGEDADFGISSFKRRNKGTNKEYSSRYYGYRYAMSKAQSFVALVINNETVLVYADPKMMTDLGLSFDDDSFQKTFFATLYAVDAAASNGGTMLSSLDSATYYFTSEKSVRLDAYTYNFVVEVEEGYYYACVFQDDSNDGSGGARFAVTGVLTAAEDTSLELAPTGFAALGRFFQKLDWRPLWVSLRTTLAAIVVIFVLGLLAAWLTIGVSSRVKGVLDTVFTIPMVIPPTVCGFLLLLIFGSSTAVGRWFINHGIDIVFTWPAAVIACIVVGFPMMYRTARGAFESLDPSMLDAARTLGWGEGKIFVKLMLPLAWPTIASGTVLAYARAVGEFGATLFFAGNYAGITQTIPIAIYFDWMGGKTNEAIFWVIVVILVSFLVILFINIYSSRSQRFRSGYVTKRERKRKKQEAKAAKGVAREGAATEGAATKGVAAEGAVAEGAREGAATKDVAAEAAAVLATAKGAYALEEGKAATADEGAAKKSATVNGEEGIHGAFH